MNKKYYFTMTNTFLSGWGRAENKKNKVVFECDSMDEAIIVKNNAKNRDEMKCINIVTKKPYYDSNFYHVSSKTKENCNVWFIKDYFKNNID